MALLLFIDTSANPGTVMLAAGGRILAVRQNGNERDHAATINLMAGEVLEEAGKSWQDLGGVAVCNGPGSYTGLRIGLATAKGYCYVLGKPLLLQNRLELLARQQTIHHPDGAVFMALLKARNAEYFAAAYDTAGKELAAPQHIFQQNLKAITECMESSKIILTTDDTEAFSAAQLIQPESVYSATVDPDFWALSGERQFLCQNFASLHLAEPFYLKAAYTTVKTN